MDIVGSTVAGIALRLRTHQFTYNSIGTLITRDFYLHWRPEATIGKSLSSGLPF